MSERSHEISELAKLHSEGAISDEEFAELKRQLIDSSSEQSTFRWPHVLAVAVALALLGVGAVLAIGQLGGSDGSEPETVAATIPSNTESASTVAPAEHQDPNAAEIERLNDAADQLNEGLRLLPVVLVDSGIEQAQVELEAALERETSCDGLDPYLLPWEAATATLDSFALSYSELATDTEVKASRYQSSDDARLADAASTAYEAQRNWRDSAETIRQSAVAVSIGLWMRAERGLEDCR